MHFTELAVHMEACSPCKSLSLLQSTGHVKPILRPSTNIRADINVANVVLSCPKLAAMDEDEIWDVIGGGYTDEVTRIDGQPLESRLPGEYTQSANWEGWDDQSNSDLRLLDFGESFLQGAEPEMIGQPPDLRIPEIIFTKRFDYRVDLWCTGAVVSFSGLFDVLPT